MAASDLPWTTDHSEYTEKRDCCTGAERLSIEPWNTTTDGYADCEDMPRKSVDKKFPDDPVQQKRGNCTLFLPSGEDGFGQSPKSGQGTSPLWGLGQGPKVLKPLISAIFKVWLSLFFRLRFFIDYLTLPIPALSLYHFPGRDIPN